MADETTTTQAETEGAEGVDWKAKYEEMRGHMRDWEKKAKANQGAADELEKLKAAQMTEQEKERERADKAESELAAMKAEQARTEAALRTAKETGVPLELLMYCADEEAMTEFAKKYAENAHVASAPTAHSAPRIIRSGETKPTNGQIFADFAEGLFSKK